MWQGAKRARKRDARRRLRAGALPALLVTLAGLWFGARLSHPAEEAVGTLVGSERPVVNSRGRPLAPGARVVPPGMEWSRGGGCAWIDASTRADRRRMQAFARGRKGFVVWESRRPSGTTELKYRIWKRNLDGSGLSLISGQPYRNGYSHFGARVSPDGRFIVFAAAYWDLCSNGPRHRSLYDGAYIAAPYDAWIVELDPQTFRAGAPRELVSLRGLVGTAGQNRIFEWKDGRTLLVNVPSHNAIYEVDVIDDRIGRRVLGGISGEANLSPCGGFLFCAAPGGVSFRPVRHTAAESSLGAAAPIPGCQATISAGGDALVWMITSGQVGVYDLIGHRTPTDPRQPGRNLRLHDAIRAAAPPYHHCYFPALGRSGHVLACGASRFPPRVDASPGRKRWLRQSHCGADYEIFLIDFDPGTLEVRGPAVRYSFNTHEMYPHLFRAADLDHALRLGHALDRWPDVWIRYRRDAMPAAIWPPAPLDTAHRLETTDPAKAVATYERLAQAGNEAAGRRLATLRSDEHFRRELAAWDLLGRMRAAESTLRPPADGPASFRRNAAFAAANRDAVKTLKAGFGALIAAYADTRAALEARRLVATLDLDVPRPTPESERVVAVVDATVREISTPLAAERIFPYTQAFTTIRCRVDHVTSGALTDREIVVVLMSMNGGENLAAASFRPGDRLIVQLGRWDAQTHFHHHKHADEILALDATYYFAFDAQRAR
jgi:hypothetical protein